MSIRIGSFIKTSAPQIVEVLGLTGLDFGAIDAEHAPFGRAELDLMMLAGRTAGLPLLVRIPDHHATTILQTLDIGAHGLIVPHVDIPEQAAEIVRRARFEGGERGFSNSARFGRYGATTIGEAIDIGDRAEILCQIESPLAIDNADAIAATPGVAGLLVGRADLALSMGLRSLDEPRVIEGARAALAAARRQGKVAGIVIGSPEEMPAWLEAGADLFIIGTDQSLLRNAASQMARAARANAGQ